MQFSTSQTGVKVFALQEAEVKFVHPVSPGGSVKILPVV